MNIVLNDLGFGDSSKGAWGEYFALRNDADLSVRYAGGCQGFHYIRHEGKPHPANQFSPASLVRPNLQTVIAGNVPTDPFRLLREGRVMQKRFGLDNPLSRILLTPDSPIITPAHDLLCGLRERHSEHQIGTTGVGVRELMSDIAAGDESLVFRVKDFFNSGWQDKFTKVVHHQLDKTHDLGIPDEILSGQLEEYSKRHPLPKLIEEYEQLLGSVGGIVDGEELNSLIHKKSTIFEMAQGTLLDRDHGFKPHVTSTTTTLKPIRQYSLNPSDTRFVFLCRAYMTRHGPGFFPTETDELNFPDDNGKHEFQGDFRYGWLDLHLLRYALDVNSLYEPVSSGSLAVSHLDQLSHLEQIPVVCGRNCDGSPQFAYLRGWQTDIGSIKSADALPKEAKQYLDFMSVILDIPIGYVSVGPTQQHRFEVRPQ